MKKYILLAVATLLTIGGYAQDDDDNRIVFGIKAGLNLSTITDANLKIISTSNVSDHYIDGSKVLAGFFIGGHVNFNFTEHIGLQPELMFTMLGGQSDDWVSTMSTRYNYLTVPVLLDVKFDDFSIFVGPQFGFNVYRRGALNGVEFEGKDYDAALESVGLKFNVFDIAATIGLQYAFESSFLVSARYTLSLNPVIRPETDDMEITGGGNRVWQIGVGYQF